MRKKKKTRTNEVVRKKKSSSALKLINGGMASKDVDQVMYRVSILASSHVVRIRRRSVLCCNERSGAVSNTKTTCQYTQRRDVP